MPRELSSDDLERVYRHVEADVLTHSTRQDHPVAVLLGGQPGSGKTALSGLAVHELAAHGGVVVTSTQTGCARKTPPTGRSRKLTQNMRPT